PSMRPRRSVPRRVGRHRSKESKWSALASKHRAPETLRVVREDVLDGRRLDDPRAVLELALELAGPPSRVPHEHTRTPELAERVGVDLRLEESDRAEHERLLVGRLDEVREDDHRGLLDGTPDEHVSHGFGESRELGDGIVDGGLRGAVEHDS